MASLSMALVNTSAAGSNGPIFPEKLLKPFMSQRTSLALLALTSLTERSRQMHWAGCLPHRHHKINATEQPWHVGQACGFTGF